MRSGLAVCLGMTVLAAGAFGAPIFLEDFNSGIPGNWVVTDNAVGGLTTVWSDLVGCGEFGNFTGGTGGVACVSTDSLGADVEVDTELISPLIDLTAFPGASLSYVANYQNLAGSDFLDVDVSTNGGSSWTNLLRWNETHGAFHSTSGELVVLPLDAYVGHTINLRWYHYDPNESDWNWYAQIDDVVVDAETAVPEPASLGMLATGLIAFGLLLGWRRRNEASIHSPESSAPKRSEPRLGVSVS